jgi:RecA DNA recombination protein
MASALLSRIPGILSGTAGGERGALAAVLSGQPDWQARPAPETVPTGVPEVDALTGGLPRGCLTEIVGPASSGRTGLLLSLLAEATAREEVCSLIDAADAFEPAGAAASGVRLDKLLWVRCSGDAERALKATDLLIQGGGFGLVAMDLGDTAPETARRISLTSWFRLRRAVEHTSTVLVALARQPNAKTCASLVVECARERAAWSGACGCSHLLRGMEVRMASRKPARHATVRFRARALAFPE